MKLNEAVSIVQDTDILSVGEQVKLSENYSPPQLQLAFGPIKKASPKANMPNIAQGRYEMRDYNITKLKKSHDIEMFLAQIINMHDSGDNITKYKRKVNKIYKAIERAIYKSSSDRSEEGHFYMIYLGEMAESARELIKQQSRQ